MQVRSLVLALSLVLASAVRAQEPLVGSAGQVILLPRDVAGAGTLESTSYIARARLALRTSGRVESSSYVLAVGAAAAPATLSVAAPVVLGTQPGLGTPGGGETVDVVGFGLAGALGVSFGGSAAGSVTSLANTVVRADTPGGVNPFGNPLGPVAVEVTGTLGGGARDGAFLYAPALLEEGVARVGGEIEVRFHQTAGHAYALLLGTSIPGFALPLPPVVGALEVVDGLKTLTPLLIATGSDTRTLQVPPNPALAGATIELQSASLSSFFPSTGSFTNRVEVVIQP